MEQQNNDTRNRISASRMLAVSGFVALGAGTALNIVFGANFPGSIVPNTNTVTPCVNGLCAFICLLFIFMPQNQGILLLILVIQSIYDVLTGFDMLGLFHFMLINLILFCKGFYKHKARWKLAAMALLWFLLLHSLLPFGVERFVFAVVVTLFMASAFVYIYCLLFDKLSFLLPEMEAHEEVHFQLPEPGGVLNLKGIGLTQRQCECIHACMKGEISYKQIGEQFCVSESTIKKDMKVIFDLFGVQNREKLRLLLCRYELLD